LFAFFLVGMVVLQIAFFVPQFISKQCAKKAALHARRARAKSKGCANQKVCRQKN
jgi:hypothetical protein